MMKGTERNDVNAEFHANEATAWVFGDHGSQGFFASLFHAKQMNSRVLA